MPLKRLFIPGDVPELNGVHEPLRSGDREAPRTERMCVTGSGEQVPALLSAALLDGRAEEQGTQALHIILILVNISERKRLEFELAHARKLESVGQLAAGIAHEINTPTQFVGDNAVLERRLCVLLKLSDVIEKLAARSDGRVEPGLLDELRMHAE